MKKESYDNLEKMFGKLDAEANRNYQVLCSLYYRICTEYPERVLEFRSGYRKHESEWLLMYYVGEGRLLPEMPLATRSRGVCIEMCLRNVSKEAQKGILEEGLEEHQGDATVVVPVSRITVDDIRVVFDEAGCVRTPAQQQAAMAILCSEEEPDDIRCVRGFLRVGKSRIGYKRVIGLLLTPGSGVSVDDLMEAIEKASK